MSFIKDKLKSIDVYGHRVQLYMEDDQDRSKSMIGGTFTILSGIALSWLLFIEVWEIAVPRAETAIIQEYSDVHLEKGKAFNYSETKLFHFHILRQEGRRKEDQEVFYVETN